MVLTLVSSTGSDYCQDVHFFQILANPFEDIIPRTLPKKADKGGEERKKSKSKATK